MGGRNALPEPVRRWTFAPFRSPLFAHSGKPDPAHASSPSRQPAARPVRLIHAVATPVPVLCADEKDRTHRSDCSRKLVWPMHHNQKLSVTTRVPVSTVIVRSVSLRRRRLIHKNRNDVRRFLTQEQSMRTDRARCSTQWRPQNIVVFPFAKRLTRWGARAKEQHRARRVG